MPNGFQPEGITIGSAPFAYFGSLANGDISCASLNTGRGGIISEGLGAEHPTVGLKTGRHDRLFLAGGGSGDLRTVGTRFGAEPTPDTEYDVVAVDRV